MRRSIAALVMIPVMALAAGAAAQPAVLVKSRPIHGTVADPLAEVPGAAAWIRDEARRQAQAPTDLGALELAMLTRMSDDIEKVARRQKLSFDELSVMVLQRVVAKAAGLLDTAVHARRRALERSKTPEASDPEMQALLVRKAGLLALINELTPRMTENSRMVAAATQ